MNNFQKESLRIIQVYNYMIAYFFILVNEHCCCEGLHLCDVNENVDFCVKFIIPKSFASDDKTQRCIKYAAKHKSNAGPEKSEFRSV